MLMPGMLTSPQMAQLDSAHGTTFDRLFLMDNTTAFIALGAIDMVHQLNASGEQQDDGRQSMYATNVEADQSAEIARMQRMLVAMPLHHHRSPFTLTTSNVQRRTSSVQRLSQSFP